MIVFRTTLLVLLLYSHRSEVKCQLHHLLEDKKPECDCESNERSLVCGTDGRTYQSPCEIERARCEGYPVKVKNEGECVDSPNCFDVRELAIAQASRGNHRVIIPQCKEDGSYLEVQCHRTTGYCWCVDHNGKHIQGTSVRNRELRCNQPGKRINRRGSAIRRPKRGCSSTDKTTFNKNLVKVFKSEYELLQNPPDFGLPANQETQRVIRWKFDQLDRDKDNVLRRREVRGLRKMAKKTIEPHHCAKTFVRHCDFDNDKKISQVEWSKCLLTDINIFLRIFMSLNSEENPMSGSTERKPSPTGDAIQRQGQPFAQSPPTPRKTVLIKESNEDVLEECRVVRQKALETQKLSPQSGVYIPECKKSGRYKDIQCFENKDNAVCWCVNPTNGKPIHGTTYHSGRPRCRKIRRTAKMFKGCKIQHKQTFLYEFLEYLANEMILSARNFSFSTTGRPTDEQAARWKFKELDLNSNEVLERRSKEWKTFRTSWRRFRKSKRSRKRLKKCWRNLLWYCDKIGNDDKNISLEEWLKCIEVKKDEIRRPYDTLRGKNPFDRILKPLQVH
ncbi:SPARC-related modular calcium-binding protein 1-like isoform X2 [Tachypleus tridentatus]|uniref:SPARC-related modular calcium-binding protein 1-like isoform X2 n=1 Tax=Tachypleus tridentatus TaxID=6853 RepID=UPI003FD553BB